MKDIIESLRTLNEIDVKIQTIQKDLDRIPKELTTLEETNSQVESQLEVRRIQITQLKADADAMTLELKVGDEALKKFSNQMSQIRTNREMEAVRRQIETQKMFNSKTERKALEMMEQTEVLEKELGEAATQFETDSKTLSEERTRAEKDVGELSGEKETLDAQRTQLAKDIPQKELETYNRIVVNRGYAFAHVKDGYCSACFIQLPPQVHNLALMAKELVTCPSCSRILTAKLQ